MGHFAVIFAWVLRFKKVRFLTKLIPKCSMGVDTQHIPMWNAPLYIFLTYTSPSCQFSNNLHLPEKSIVRLGHDQAGRPTHIPPGLKRILLTTSKNPPIENNMILIILLRYGVSKTGNHQRNINSVEYGTITLTSSKKYVPESNKNFTRTYRS